LARIFVKVTTSALEPVRSIKSDTVVVAVVSMGQLNTSKVNCGCSSVMPSHRFVYVGLYFRALFNTIGVFSCPSLLTGESLWHLF